MRAFAHTSIYQTRAFYPAPIQALPDQEVQWILYTGLNTPEIANKGSLVFRYVCRLLSGRCHSFASDYNSWLVYGKAYSGSYTQSPALTKPRKPGILTKTIDDGLPAYVQRDGLIQKSTATFAPCSTTDVAATAASRP